ncbi:protein-glutamine gamma-glutamyltransferase E-like isoform X2 [Trachinotus anak]|uniref:protein-glutamine gamma-glutamyltransferase E-like isoform X2 n=1 Tax=Trachinotus anak TaxID=443729 RepID=UPI0039F1B8D8
MDCMQQTKQKFCGTGYDHCQLKLVNFEAHENHLSHETQGLSEKRLVVRRGKPFKFTLMFHSQLWSSYTESLVLDVRLGNMAQRIPVHFSDEQFDPHCWSAKIYPGNINAESVTIHICTPVSSSVAVYTLLVHIETKHFRRSYAVGSFVLLCNPWLKDDPVYIPQDVQIQEYIKSDYGMIYMGTNLNVCQRPWSFGQYEPGVLEACLKLLQLSPQHLQDKHKDYVLRADPVYLSRVICAMVNCEDDMGILRGRWQGSYKDGVKPSEWSGSADILHRWVSSNFSPVCYGQCWVFASVLCTVMRVLGVPSRVVTVFNAAHDGNANVKIEEYYSTTGEKLNLSKDSIWNFHVWVECWMRRPDLGEEFDGWQVVDPTPQEKSDGIFRCGPCPVVAVQQRCLGAHYDTPFVCASVDADVIRLIVRNGQVVSKKVNTELVGELIYTKSIGSDSPENLTQTYKTMKSDDPAVMLPGHPYEMVMMCSSAHPTPRSLARSAGLDRNRSNRMDCRMAEESLENDESPPSLEVSLKIDGMPSVGESIPMCVTVTNQSSNPRVLMENLNAQIKEYNRNPQESFWKMQKEVHIKPHEVLKLQHTIPPSEYESVLAGDDIMNFAVVIKDVTTEERFLDTQEVNISSPQINIEIEGGDSIEMRREHTAQVSFTNKFTKTLNGAVLTVEGSGLLHGKQEASLSLLKPGEKIEKQVSIMASSPGTKVLMATFSHSNSPNVVSRSFHKVSVTSS